jgi:putative DNA primase/helicase
VALPENSNALATLDREIAKVERAEQGTRNDTLNKAAFALGQLVGGGHLDDSEVTERLANAARSRGLSDTELLATIHSGLTAGKKTPNMRVAEGAHSTHTAHGAPTFEVREDGVFAINDKWECRVCSQLWIDARTRNEHGEQWGLLLRLVDSDGRMKYWSMPQSLLAAEGAAYRARLLDMGLLIAPGRQAKQLLELYLHTNPSQSILCVDRIGWYESVFVLPDETIGVNTTEIVFQSAGASNHLLRVEGSLANWRDQIGNYCSGNRFLVFSVSLAFAAALLPLSGLEGGGFHFRGSSTVGKTTALLVAGSVWGGGGERGFLRTWNSTANGLESVAANHNHVLLIVDEMGEVEPNILGEGVYMLCNGAGKLRQSRETTLKRQLEWQLLFLSSGEIGLSEHLALVGRRSRGGQEVRIVNIEADAGKGLGIFEDLHDFAGAHQFAQHLATASRRVYGSPIRAFLQSIVGDRVEISQAIKTAVQGFQERHSPERASGEVLRVAARFALVAFAGELACRLGILPCRDGEAEQAAASLFREWLENRQSHGASDEEQAIRQVREFLERHGQQRFQVLLRSRHGSADRDRSPIVVNRAGFIRPTEVGDIERYYILPEVFEKEVCKGFDAKTVAKTLQERGWLENDSGRLQTQIRTPEGNKVRAYCIRSSILE